MKRTTLFEKHRALGAKFVEFGGWEMPVYYRGIGPEHLAVRASGGIFDISHMGEFVVSGPAAATFLSKALTNRVGSLDVGWGHYTLLCNEAGGVIDDLYLFRLFDDVFTLVVNASRIETDFRALEEVAAANPGAYELTNVSERTDALAIQGPNVSKWIDLAFSGTRRFGADVAQPSDLKKNQIAQFEVAPWNDQSIWISRTGYTGEDGFEVLFSPDIAEAVWDRVMETGAPHGVEAVGLGARDTLRLEACYPLYGHELDESGTPLEAGVGFFVDLKDGVFRGAEALRSQKTKGISRRLVALCVEGKAPPPRADYPVFADKDAESAVGATTSGAPSPSLKTGIALAYVPVEFAKVDTSLWIESRGRRFPARVVKKPFVHRAS